MCPYTLKTFKTSSRNKNEGYFVASELLKKICSTRVGLETIFKSPALLKRLHSLVEDLTRKGIYEKRSVFACLIRGLVFEMPILLMKI